MLTAAAVVVIVMMTILGVVFAAKRRWTQNDANVPFQAEKALGTLGNLTAIVGALVDASDNEYRALSVRSTWSIRDLTVGEGPITVGYAHGDYTATEIKECLEAGAAMTRNDKVAAEQANRLVRVVGVFSGVGTDETLNDGKEITTCLNWVIPDGGAINQFAYNHSGAALAGGAEVIQQGKLRLKWL